MNTHAPVQGKTLLDADGLGRTLSRIAHEIIEGNPELDVAGSAAGEAVGARQVDRVAFGASRVALVGIQTRGVPLAHRLARLIEERAGVAPALGAVDITFYRDDVTVRGGEAPLAAQPLVRATQLDFPLDGRTVVLVDDVLYTGRTIRAAIEALFDYGRPARVQLAVLVDRGHRELPIRPDYVGKNLPTARGERIQVQLVEVDEVDAVLLVESPEEESR
jgi:pyrimidine operon attenuation protein / uracil phosphoribosyltransferase